MKKITTLILLFLMMCANSYSADFTVTGSFPNNNWNNSSTDYKMTQIGTTEVYSLEKLLPAGSYEYKVFNTGTWGGPDASGDNRVFTLATETTVRFYAKLDNSTIRFFSSAQQLYAIGSIVGGWDISNKIALTNSETSAVYKTDYSAGEYKIISLDKNGAIVWNDITPNNQALGTAGNYSLKLDYETFTTSMQSSTTKLEAKSSYSNIFIMKGKINAQFAGIVQVELYTTTGQLINKCSAVNQFTQVIKAGAYLLRIDGETHKVIVQ